MTAYREGSSHRLYQSVECQESTHAESTWIRWESHTQLMSEGRGNNTETVSVSTERQNSTVIKLCKYIRANEGISFLAMPCMIGRVMLEIIMRPLL